MKTEAKENECEGRRPERESVGENVKKREESEDEDEMKRRGSLFL